MLYVSTAPKKGQSNNLTITSFYQVQISKYLGEYLLWLYFIIGNRNGRNLLISRMHKQTSDFYILMKQEYILSSKNCGAYSLQKEI